MAAPSPELSGTKAQRIVDAMRVQVGLRGATGATFEHVAREAGVSRGLLHYYFGTKEKLLAETVRRDCDFRLEQLSASVAEADSVDALLGGMVERLRLMVAEAPEFFVLFFELHAIGARNPEIAAELVELHRRTREHMAGILTRARDDGVITLAAAPDAVAEVLFSLADGLAMRLVSEPGRDFSATFAAGLAAARTLVLPA